MQGLKSLAWHILLHCLSSAIFLNTPITQTSNLQAECQENATLVAGFFFSQNNNNLKSTIYISSPVLPGPAVYFIMCQYEERIYL